MADADIYGTTGKPPANPAEATRRRAAYAAFGPLLAEPQLIEALWLLQRSYKDDRMSTLIAYVNAVTERFGLMDRRKDLYADYYGNLRLSDAELPPDPWPLMTGEPPARPAPPRETVTTAPPPEASPPAAGPGPAEAGEPVPESPGPQPAAEDLPPAVKVFSAYAAAVLAETEHRHAGEKDDFLGQVVDLLPQAGLTLGARESARAWASAPGPGQWKPSLREAELADLAHLIYVALCDAVGPVAADEIVTLAVAAAARLPEARQFSPRLLL
jgi:hypothetical protein